jgi:hypothetical protein
MGDYIVTSLYRLTRGYVDVVTPPGPVYYYFEFTRWDNFSHLVILAIVTWIGDGLVVSLDGLCSVD